MYLGYERLNPNGAVMTVANLTIAANATHAEIQADTGVIRYTMDNATNPNHAVGMILPAAGDPKTFLIEDIRRIRFINAGAQAFLNIHYFAGRNV